MALVSAAYSFGSGAPLSISVGLQPGNTNVFIPSVIDYASYLIISGSGSGTLSFLALGTDNVFRQLVSPSPLVIAPSTTYNGGFGGVTQGPFLGLQVLANITGAVSYGLLIGTTRP